MKKLQENKYYQLGLTMIIVVAVCILFYFFISKLGQVLSIFGGLFKIFTPVILGFIFAYLLNPIVQFFNSHLFAKTFAKSKMAEEKKKRISNGLSIFLSCIITLGIILILFSFIIPEVLKSIEMIIVNTPAYLEEIKNYLLQKLQNYDDLDKLIIKNYTEINNYFNDIISTNLLPKINEWISTFSSGFIIAVKVAFNVILGFVISIYFLADKDHFKAQVKKFIYSILPIKLVNDILDNTRHTDKMFGNFLTGKILDGAVVGFITFCFLTIFGYPYALLIGVLIGLTNLIPYFGPYIGTIPSALLILMDSPTKCLIFIIFIMALQQVDSYFIDPHLSGAKTGLKSFWVLFAILIFGSLFGLPGLLIGVPIFALIYGYVNNLCTNSLRKKNLPTKTESYENLIRINSETKKPVKRSDD